ncbi:MAG: SUMF1/EgtB/PvdO family nonheme iron enzyme [Pelagibacterales bacterium]|nr:SUMF1/EgtB/PvdO family nonheme iron enzyme [Pelagibacterales bacterium]
MYVNWNIGGGFNYFDSIKVDIEISDVTYEIYQNKDFPTNSGYLLDSLSTYANEINAGQKVKYTLQWYCQDEARVKEFNAATLPYYNMVYIPKISNYLYTEISTSGEYDYSRTSSPFYIDTYEITDNVYNAPELNTPIEANSFPKGSLSYDDANTFTQNRHPENYSNIFCDELSQIEFKIPQDYQWQIASRCQYNWENKTCEQYFDYPINVVGDNAIISCNFINYSGCCDVYIDCVQSVDQYPESISPFGLYGTSGNLQEWVVNNNSSISANKLIGGYFSSTYDEVTTTSVYYSFSDTTMHSSYGLRTLFDAEEFLEIWRDCVDQ